LAERKGEGPQLNVILLSLATNREDWWVSDINKALKGERARSDKLLWN